MFVVSYSLRLKGDSASKMLRLPRLLGLAESANVTLLKGDMLGRGVMYSESCLMGDKFGDLVSDILYLLGVLL